MGLSFRPATDYDAEALRSLALSRVVSSRSEARSGLIDYRVSSVERYREKLVLGDILVAQDGSRVVGFCDSYGHECLARVFPDDPLVERIRELGTAPYAYLNTIAIDETYEGRGLAARFARECFVRHAACECWSVIVHAPLLNRTSTLLAKRVGFSLREEVPAHGLLFGIYCRPRTPLQQH